MKLVHKVRPVAHQPAGFGKLAPMVKSRKLVSHRQHDELHATGDEQRVRTDQECIGPLFDERCKGIVDVTTCAGADDFDLLPDSRSRRLQFRDIGLRDKGILGIDEHTKARCSGQKLVEEPEPFCRDLHAEVVDPGGIPARPIEASNETDLDRIDTAAEVGMDEVAAFAANTSGVPVATMTAT